MDLIAAENLARDLLKKHLPRFRFEWNNNTATAAYCSKFLQADTFPPLLRPGTISFSRIYAEQWNEEQFTKTMLHEIAHGLDLTKNPSHGAEWKKICRSLGIKPERCVSAEDKIDLTKHHKWIVYCPKGHYTTRARRTSQRRSCGKCSPKVFNPAHVMTFIENTPTNLAKVKAIREITPAPVTRMPVTKLPNMRPTAKPVKVAAQRSRAQQYDKGAAFIDWD